MTYDIFSIHAPTGESATRVVSTNENSLYGREIGFPSNLDLYTRHISDADGSQSVVESRSLSELVGSRLYLHHRPLTNTSGQATTITTSDGTIDTSYTTPTQAYIVFSSLPSADFTVSYVAVPDCDFSWSLNTLQDSVMEIEKILGPSNDSSYAGIRNLKLGLFDSPTGSTASGILQNGVYLSHLDQNIVVASSDDSTLQATRGAAHTIQVGRATDNFIADVTGFTISQSNGTLHNTIVLGTKTGDTINWKGSASGAGPLTVGGAEWPGYSGVMFSLEMTGQYYTGSMLKVHGDAAFMGNVKAYGNITVINATGTTSTILGDFTVRDELFVNGVTHLIGEANTNRLNVEQDLHINSNIIADDGAGAGGNGQSLVDNLDCSEVAHSYNYVIQNTHPYSIISAPMNTGHVVPKNLTYRPWFKLDGNHLVGDVFSITGSLNASASSSGAHPHILQLLLNEYIASGTYQSYYGSLSGVWSPGMMDPGSLYIKMLDGQSAGLVSPIYGYTVEGTGTVNTITRLNVFLPEAVANPPQTNDKYILYNPNNITYNTLSAAGGADPTVTIQASASEPLAMSFANEVRIMTADSSAQSMRAALTASVTGMGGLPVTGVAYVFADSNNTDPENPPIFKIRPMPIRMPGQTPVGEVVAEYNGTTWSILETVSYRPGGMYDSSWIPICSIVDQAFTSGRLTPGLTSASTAPGRFYFHHYLGSDVDIGKINADLYLGRYHTGSISWNRTNTPMYSLFGQDARNTHGLAGALLHVPLGAKRTSSVTTDRDASIIYLDSALIGVDISPGLLAAIPTGSTTMSGPDYLRLIIRKDN